jgi:hypothetical protein
MYNFCTYRIPPTNVQPWRKPVVRRKRSMTIERRSVLVCKGTVCCSFEQCKSPKVYRDTHANRLKVQLHARTTHNVVLSTVTDNGPSKSRSLRCGALCFRRTDRLSKSAPTRCRRVVLRKGSRCYDHKKVDLQSAAVAGAHQYNSKAPKYALSTILNGGGGVFARRCYHPGDIITVFDGDVLDRSIPLSNREKDWTVEVGGLRVRGSQQPVRGRGLGSFINGSDHGHKANVRFHAFRTSSLVAVECMRFIRPNQELFVSYGAGYWRRWRTCNGQTKLELLHNMCVTARRLTTNWSSSK